MIEWDERWRKSSTRCFDKDGKRIESGHPEYEHIWWSPSLPLEARLLLKEMTKVVTECNPQGLPARSPEGVDEVMLLAHKQNKQLSKQRKQIVDAFHDEPGNVCLFARQSAGQALERARLR